MNHPNAKSFLSGMGSALLLVACAGSTFNYKYYGLDLLDQKLLSHDPSGDLSLSTCTATSSDSSPCIAMFAAEFEMMKADYMNIETELASCQQALGQK